MNNGETDTAKKRRGINSVEIGLGVLDAIIDLKHPATLKAIAERSGLAASQAHRYVSSLLNCGILRREQGSSLYDLGPKALHIGLAAMARTDALSIAEEAAKRFSEKHGATVLMSVWGTYGPTIIRWYHGVPPVLTALSIGSVLPVTTSATGRVFMSYLPDGFLDPFLVSEGWTAPLDRNAKLIQDRDQILKTGRASVDSEVIPGLRAHAAPVLGLQDMLVAVMTVVASSKGPKSKDKSSKSRLTAWCQELSHELGGR